MDYFEKLREKYKDNATALKHIENFKYYSDRGREGLKDSTYCGLKQCDAPDVPFHIDHIVPRALGGSEDSENLVDACQPCNYRKRDQRDWVTLDGRAGKAYTMDYVNGKWRMKDILLKNILQKGIAKYNSQCYNSSKERGKGQLRIFKTKWFTRYAKQEGITDSMLCEAIERAEKGLIDADLGGCVIKQRVSREGQGRSKGYRVLIAFRTQKRAFFMFGFAKNEYGNIKEDELKSLKEIADKWFKVDDKEIKRSIINGSLQEVIYEKKVQSIDRGYFRDS